jgi:hypothetical protein
MILTATNPARPMIIRIRVLPDSGHGVCNKSWASGTNLIFLY